MDHRADRASALALQLSAPNVNAYLRTNCFSSDDPCDALQARFVFLFVVRVQSAATVFDALHIPAALTATVGLFTAAPFLVVAIELWTCPLGRTGSTIVTKGCSAPTPPLLLRFFFAIPEWLSVRIFAT